MTSPNTIIADLVADVNHLMQKLADKEKRVAELTEALESIIPFIPKSSAKEGGAVAYSEAVRAADKVRAAIYKDMHK